jgi:hypothetical protein
MSANKLQKLNDNRSFLHSSAIIFFTNILIAICNYLITIFASNKIGNNYSSWVAITGFLAFLGTFGNGMFIYLSSELAKYSSLSEKISFANKFSDFVISRWYYSFVFIPIITILGMFFFKIELYILILLSTYIFLSYYFGLKQNILLGCVMIPEYAISNTLSTVVRLIVTITLVNMKFGLASLIYGLVANMLVYWALSSYYFSKFTKNIEKKPINFNFDSKSIINISLYLILISFILNWLVVIINSNSTFSIEDKLLFSVIFTFGQILHFGSISGLDALAVYSSKDKTNKHYLFSLAVSVALSLLGTVAILILQKPLFSLFGRQVYPGFVQYFSIYAMFIMIYNALYIQIQYLIASRRLNFIQYFIIPILILIISRFVNININQLILLNVVVALYTFGIIQHKIFKADEDSLL